MFKRNRMALTFLLAVVDGCCVLLAYAFAVYVAMPMGMAFGKSLVQHVPYMLIFIVVWYSAALDQRLWGSRRGEGMMAYLFAVTKAVGDATIFCVFVMAMFRRQGIEREFLVTFCLATSPGVPLNSLELIIVPYS